MTLDYTLKQTIPHAVYKMYSKDDTLLYVGCSTNPFGNRLRRHGEERPWIKDVTTVKVAWYPGWEEGTDAEYKAIQDEHPKYNISQPVRGEPHGGGHLCPKCGGGIENPRPGRAYCRACYAAYTRARRANPKLRLPHLTIANKERKV